MLREWLGDHFFRSLLLLVVLGAMLGILGIYAMQFFNAIWGLVRVVYEVMSIGGSNG